MNKKGVDKYGKFYYHEYMNSCLYVLATYINEIKEKKGCFYYEEKI